MAWFLGIDGGGTSTRCVVGDEHNVLGRASTVGCNIVRVGPAQARAAVRAAITSACCKAGIEPAQAVSACIGTAGISVPDVSERIRGFIAELVPGRIIVCGDDEIAMEAAFGNGSGVLVASGTGSIAFGRTAEGRTVRAGGHGFAISDEGSGHWIGRSAVSVLMRALDRQQETLLLNNIQEVWNVHSPAEIVKLANAVPGPDFAKLFPAVLRASEAGDAVASELLARAGRELAVLAELVARRLWPAGAEVTVATVGGIFASSSLVREQFRSSLQRECPALRVREAVCDPVLGALSMARKNWRADSSDCAKA
jgi:N-acetylglucosamine kinase-like BadF-type ATPase